MSTLHTHHLGAGCSPSTQGTTPLHLHGTYFCRHPLNIWQDHSGQSNPKGTTALFETLTGKLACLDTKVIVNLLLSLALLG